MDIFFHTGLGNIVTSWGGSSEASGAFIAQRRDGVKVRFIPFNGEQGLVASDPLPGSFGLRFMGKFPGDYNGISIVDSATWSIETDASLGATVYVGRPSHNTHQLAALFAAPGSGIESRSGAADTLVLTDAGKAVLRTHSAALAQTIPANASVAFPLNTEITVYNASDDDLTLDGDTGVTFTDVTIAPGAYQRIKKTATDAWESVTVEERASVELMAQFTWRDTSDIANEPVSTRKFTWLVENDVINGTESEPGNSEDPTQFYTKSESDGRYVTPLAVQAWSEEEKDQACENIGATRDAGDVVRVSEQTWTEEEQDIARANINAASATTLEAVNEDVTDLLDNVVRSDAQTLSGAQKTQVLANIGAWSGVDITNQLASKLGTTTTPEQIVGYEESLRLLIQAAPLVNNRRDTLYLPHGNSTTADLVGGALETVIGTAVARDALPYVTHGTVTANASTDVLSSATLGDLAVGGLVFLTTSGTLPGGFELWKAYEITGITGSGPYLLGVKDPVTDVPVDITSVGSGTHTLQLKGSYFGTRLRRKGFYSAGTAGASCGVRHTEPQFFFCNDQLGNKEFRARFMIADNGGMVATARTFIGLRDSSANPSNSDPSSWTNCIGLIQNAGDANFSIYYAADVAGTPVDLGSDFAVAKGGVYELIMRGFVGSTAGVSYKVINWGASESIVAAQITGTIDLSAYPLYRPLGPTLWRNNGATASRVDLDVCFWELQTHD